VKPVATARALGALAALALAAGLASGCDDVECVDESFVVQEGGTCATGPVQFTLSSMSCRVSITMASGDTGLPTLGAKDQDRRPLRQGGFILYSNACATAGAASCGAAAPFHLCRAERVGFHLQLSCVDGTGAPVCEADLTEP
jgi:hypothetical protein